MKKGLVAFGAAIQTIFILALIFFLATFIYFTWRNQEFSAEAGFFLIQKKSILTELDNQPSSSLSSLTRIVSPTDIENFLFNNFYSDHRFTWRLHYPIIIGRYQATSPQEALAGLEDNLRLLSSKARENNWEAVLVSSPRIIGFWSEIVKKAGVAFLLGGAIGLLLVLLSDWRLTLYSSQAQKERLLIQQKLAKELSASGRVKNFNFVSDRYSAMTTPENDNYFSAQTQFDTDNRGENLSQTFEVNELEAKKKVDRESKEKGTEEEETIKKRNEREKIEKTEEIKKPEKEEEIKEEMKKVMEKQDIITTEKTQMAKEPEEESKKILRKIDEGEISREEIIKPLPIFVALDKGKKAIADLKKKINSSEGKSLTLQKKRETDLKIDSEKSVTKKSQDSSVDKTASPEQLTKERKLNEKALKEMGDELLEKKIIKVGRDEKKQKQKETERQKISKKVRAIIQDSGLIETKDELKKTVIKESESDNSAVSSPLTNAAVDKSVEQIKKTLPKPTARNVANGFMAENTKPPKDFKEELNRLIRGDWQ